MTHDDQHNETPETATPTQQAIPTPPEGVEDLNPRYGETPEQYRERTGWTLDEFRIYVRSLPRKQTKRGKEWRGMRSSSWKSRNSMQRRTR
jgi:hypothetical protein